ncbi:uncharacterized protein [Spinacia oleracea]|uniref:FAR1 domain-containing protein n=1 Tax=Spinacia oleracea TaxID=3562 RepID=A0ABM3QXI6_SPIOL|nr:uncharacterized protein LOC130463061 [Spinacia oleracea]
MHAVQHTYDLKRRCFDPSELISPSFLAPNVSYFIPFFSLLVDHAFNQFKNYSLSSSFSPSRRVSPSISLIEISVMASSIFTLCSDFTSKASIDVILAKINADHSSILSTLMKELSKEVVVVEEASESELMLKEVRSDDEGYEIYNDYAFRKGFRIPKGLIWTSRRTGLWSMRRFVFSNVGFKYVKKETSRKYERSELRTCCTGFVQFLLSRTVFECGQT